MGMSQILILVCIGLLSGFLSGMLGIGGGIIIVPLVIMLFGLSAHQAIAVSLAVIVPTAIAGSLKHYSAGNIDLKFALLIAIGAVSGAYLGASVANMLPGETLKKILGATLVLIGLNMLFGWTTAVSRTGGSSPAVPDSQLSKTK